MAITITIDDIKRRLRLPAGSVNCVFANAGDLITAVLHGLAVGDVVAFGTTANGVTAGTLYWVRTITSPDVFEISATRGGALFALTGDGANTYSQKTVYDADITNLISEMLTGLSGTIVPASLTTYEAACKEGIICVIAGEALNMIRRQAGYAEALTVGGVVFGAEADTGDKLIELGMAILEPFTVNGMAAASKVAADAAMATGLAADANARAAAATARTARLAAADVAMADATELPQESHSGADDLRFNLDSEEYSSR